MDAISDVSRASEIYSAVPARPPLPEPLDLDDLFGFNCDFSSPGQREQSEDWIYFDRSLIFINHVDSFTGKYLVKSITSKDILEFNAGENEHGPKTEKESCEDKRETKKEKKGKCAKASKKESSLKSKGSTKGKGKKRISKEISKRSLGDQFREKLDILNDEENIPYDTSKLTVAEYYEMMDLESDEERETFLKEKLSKFVDDTTTDFNRAIFLENKVFSHEISDDFKIIGTLINSDNKAPHGVHEIVSVSNDDSSFFEHIVKCGIIIYIVNEDKSQVDEATLVFNSVLNYIDNLREREVPPQFQLPMFILVSSFMTWAFTKPLSLKEPDLPFIEKDYRKRTPHTNYKMMFELEEQVINAQTKGEIEAAVIVSGIPYGHEEFTLKFFFESAFQLVDLPIYSSSNNNIPLVHIENLSKIVKEVLKRRCDINLPFIFAKDPMNFSLDGIVKAISSNLGTGCCELVPNAWAFLTDEITQDVFDQLTANIRLESCYPLFKKGDIQWKYENGFGIDIQNVVNEYISANNLKPLNILVYGTSSTCTTDIASGLSEMYRVPYISLDNVLHQYFVTMQDQLKQLVEATPYGVNNDAKTKDDRSIEIEKPSLNGSDELRECEKSNNIVTQLEYFKKLNLKRPSDVNSLTEAQKMSILRNKLYSDRACLNHGYILNGFPLSLVQARLLYQADDSPGKLSDEARSSLGYVIYLKKVQENLAQVPSDDSQEFVYKEHRPSQLSWFKEDPQIEREAKEENRAVDETVSDETVDLKDSLGPNAEDPAIAFLLERNPGCKYLEIEVDMGDKEEVLRQILTFVEGKGVTEELITKVSSFKNADDNKEEIVTTVRYESDSKDSLSPVDSLSEIRESEELILAVRSQPLLKYLINYIYPTLTNAILEVCEVRPVDPLDFFALYLFQNNPDGRMPDPRMSTVVSEGFPNQGKTPRACHSLFLFNTAHN